MSNLEIGENNKQLVRKKPRRGYVICYSSIIFIIAILVGGIAWQYNIEVNSNYKEPDLKVAFITSDNDYNKYLYQKLDLDKGIEVDRIKLRDLESGDLDKYDIVAVSNVDLTSRALNILIEYITSSKDHSIMFFVDENTDGDDLKILNITKTDELERFDEKDNDLGYGICKPTDKKEDLTENIPFNTMPEIRAYSKLEKSDFYTEDAKDSAVILKDYSTEDSKDTFLFYKDLETGGKYLIFTIWFDAEINEKEVTESWPYIGYFFFSCFMFLEGEDIPTYRDWPYSPVPHMTEVLMIGLILGGLAIVSFIIFIFAYKYSNKHPLTGVEALETEDEIKAKQHAQEKIDELRKESDIEKGEEELEKLKEISKKEDEFTFEEIEAELPEYLQGWNSIGVHKQIGGFWTVFFILLILILPAAGFFLWLFPNYIFPTPSGQGMYSFVTNFFAGLFIFADLGTTVWMTRKFAAYRISEPRKAIASAQCFLWFQILTGAFQIMLVGFLVAVGIPSTIYAHLTYIFVVYSLFQWLGFFMVFVNILNSLQRVDVAGAGAAILAPLLVMVQMIFVPLFIQIGASNPAIGIALGGAIGAAFANFFTNLALFFASWWIFRKFFGYSGNSIFRVDFDWEMFKDMLKFGFKYAPGQALVPLVWMLQVILLSIYLDNYNNWLGYWNIAYTVAQVSVVIGLFTATMVPALSEALENNKKTLLNYDITAMIRWTNNLNFWLSAALFAVMVPLVIVLSPPQFQPVAVLMPLLVFFQLLGPYSWMGDTIFAGLDRPSYASFTWAVEQGARAVLMFIFVPILAVNPEIGIFSIMFAYIPALILKDIVVWYIIKKKLGLDGLKIHPFKTFVAPGIAGILFFLLCWILIIVTGGGLIGVLITAAFALIAGPFIYFFLSGLFGGWSKYDLEEFKRSVSIMSVAGKVANGIFKCCSAGAKLSPWKEKYIIAYYPEARIEAWELTLEKKKIENI